MRNSWKPRDMSDIRIRGARDTNRTRNISRPATPTGISNRRSIQRNIFPKPSNSRIERDAKREIKFKKKLMERYDTDEMNRRRGLTGAQHGSHTGKVGSEGFRKYTTVKGIPYARDRSPHNGYGGKKRQYAYQNEFPQSIKHRYAAAGDDVSPYRYKRDDGSDRGNTKRNNINAFVFKKRQPVESRVT